MPLPTNNLVIISDTHCGCRLAICPDKRMRLDDGGWYQPSRLQKKLYRYWRVFWDEFVPEATRGEPYVLIHNGDAIDGVHHNSTTQVSHNLEDQANIAHELLAPVVNQKKVQAYFHIRGTEAHVGKSGVEEERLAKRLGAVPNEQRQHARYELWKHVGKRRLVHCLHHIGTTGSQAYEATAVHKELAESFIEAGRWGRVPPDVVVRSHRHRCIQTKLPIQKPGEKHETGEAISVVTPCWQGKTPFVWKIPGGRLSQPQFGGIVIRYADGELFVRPKVWTVDRSRTE